MPLRRAPLESFLKLFMALFGILGEYVTGMKVSFTDPNAARHNTSVEVTLPHVHSEHEHSIQARDVNPNGMIKVWHFETGNLQHITMYIILSTHYPPHHHVHGLWLRRNH